MRDHWKYKDIRVQTHPKPLSLTKGRKPLLLVKPLEITSKKGLRLLSPRVDTDRDGIPDFRDCKPLDPTQQGFWHDLIKRKKLTKPSDSSDESLSKEEVNTLKRVEFKRDQQQQQQDRTDVFRDGQLSPINPDDVEQGVTVWLYVYNPNDSEYEETGPYQMEESLKQWIVELEQQYGAGSVIVSTQKINVNKLNRQIRFNDLKNRVSGYVEGQGFRKNVQLTGKDISSSYQKALKSKKVSQFIEGSDMALKRKTPTSGLTPFGSQRYSPVTFEQSFVGSDRTTVKAPWQRGIKENTYKLPYQRGFMTYDKRREK